MVSGLREGAIFQVENGQLVERKHSTLIDLRECAAYIVKKLRLTKISAKEHGEDLIVWKNGEVLDVDRSQRMRIEGQEVI